MGIPFPAGIRLMKREQAQSVVLSDQSKDPEDEARDVSIPWVWAVNGAASVVASILWVGRNGIPTDASAWLTVLAQSDALQYPNQ